MKETNMLASIALAFMGTLAQARENCGYGIPYDQNSPSAIIAPGGDRPTARFEWGTDVDTLPDGVWVWHYVTNNSPERLGVDWDKAAIHQSTDRGIPPGISNCNRFLIGGPAVRRDDDAPIIYGTHRGRQRAAVYVPDQSAAPGQVPTPGAGSSQPGRGRPTNSKIKSGFVDKEGKTVTVNVEVATNLTGEGFSVRLAHSPGVVVALSELTESLSGSQRETMFAQFRQQSVSVVHATFGEFSKIDDPKVFGEMLSEDNLMPLLKQRFLFFTGSPEAIASIPAKGLRNVSANLLVLDAQGLMPVLTTKVDLLVPVPQ